MRAPRLIALTVLAFLWLAIAILPTTPVGALIGVLLSLAIIAAAVIYERRNRGGNAEARRSALDAAIAQRLRALSPAQQAAIRVMDEDCRDAVNRLTGAMPGKTARQAIDALPWVLCIGTPSSGRSTMLASSGLPFGYVTPPATQLGPRSVRWWLSDRAAFIDTAGAHVAGDAGYAEWLSLLRTLESLRPVQPLHGIVVTVAADMLATGRADELDGWAKRMRERVDEALGFLGIDVPVHLAVTRCDAVPGFAEFFADLRDAERGQVWGFTLPLGGAATPAVQRITQELDLLFNALSQRALRRTNIREPLEVRLQAFQFPHWFQGIRPNLLQLTSSLFAQNSFQAQLLARGVWFTSAAEVPALGNPMLGRPVQSGRGYFIRDVLSSHVIPDGALAMPSLAELRRRLHQRMLLATPLFGAAVVASVLGVFSYTENVALLRDFSAAMNAAASGGAPVELSRLDTLRARTSTLRELVTTGAPRWMRLGMFVGDEVSPRASTIFSAFVIRDIARPEVDRARAAMESFATRHGGGARIAPEARALAEESLRLYLLLTTPRLAGEPDPSRTEDAEWLAAQLAQRWARAHNVTDPAAITRMLGVIRLHAAILGSDPRLGTPRDLQIVARTRALLAAP